LERGERSFVIDLGRTACVDAAGLGVLVSLHKRIRECGGALRLTNLNENLRGLFDRGDGPDEDEGGAGRPAPRTPPPAGPLRGAAQAELPWEEPPV
jgi:hypothetical protein